MTYTRREFSISRDGSCIQEKLFVNSESLKLLAAIYRGKLVKEKVVTQRQHNREGSLTRASFFYRLLNTVASSFAAQTSNKPKMPKAGK